MSYPAFLPTPPLGWLRNAAAGGGLLLAGLSFVGGNVTGDAVDPVEKVRDVASSPVSLCPPGWTDHKQEPFDVVIRACVRDEWFVIVHADGSFNYGYQMNTPGAEFVFEHTKVPGWR